MKKFKKILSNKLVQSGITGAIIGASGGIFGADSMEANVIFAFILGAVITDFFYRKRVI